MKRAALLAAFQVVFMMAWAAQNEHVRATAPTFRVPLEPRDPYDVLRGRYFRLSPKDGAIRTSDPEARLPEAEVRRFLGKETYFNEPALVGFCPEGDIQRVCALARLAEKPDAARGQFWSRARLAIVWHTSRWSGGQQVPDPHFQISVDLALDRFFLPNQLDLHGRENDPGWELEVCHRPGLSPLPRRLFYQKRPAFGD